MLINQMLMIDQDIKHCPKSWCHFRLKPQLDELAKSMTKSFHHLSNILRS